MHGCYSRVPSFPFLIYAFSYKMISNTLFTFNSDPGHALEKNVWSSSMWNSRRACTPTRGSVPNFQFFNFMGGVAHFYHGFKLSLPYNLYLRRHIKIITLVKMAVLPPIRRRPSKETSSSLKTNFPPLNTATLTSVIILMWRLKESLYGTCLESFWPKAPNNY